MTTFNTQSGANMKRHSVRGQFFSCVLLMFALTGSSEVAAAEFATLLSGKVIYSKDQGVGRSVAFYYGGFGLLAGAEIKAFARETYPSANLELILGKANVEIGLNKHGPSLRGAMSIPLVKHLGHARLHLNLGYELDFSNNEFSGPYMGLDLFFLN